MWICPQCGAKITDGAKCPKCKIGDPKFYSGKQLKAVPSQRSTNQGNVITDIRIPFGRWVAIMVTVSFAAVPAAIIVAIIWSAIIALVPGFLAGLR